MTLKRKPESQNSVDAHSGGNNKLILQFLCEWPWHLCYKIFFKITAEI